MEPLIPANAGGITPIHLSAGTPKEETVTDPPITSEEGVVQSVIPAKTQLTHEQTIQQLQKQLMRFKVRKKCLKYLCTKKPTPL